MDKNLPNDPLEEFFKKSLEGMDDLPSNDGWDVPSIDVWDKVEEYIQPPVAKVRPINYWKWTAIAASFTVLILAYQFYNRGHQIDNLTAEISKNSQELNSVKELLENKQEELKSVVFKEKDSPISNQESPESSLISNEQEEVVRSTIVQNRSKRTTSFSGKREGSIGGKNNDGIPSIPSTPNEDFKSNSIQNNSVVFSTEQNQNQKNNIPSNNQIAISDNSIKEIAKERTFLPIENLPNRIFETNSSNDFGNDFNIATSAESFGIFPVKFDSKFYVGGYFSKNHGMRALRSGDSNLGEIRENKIEENYKKGYLTFGGGVKLGYEFNDRWSLETGVQYSKTKIESRHTIDKNYTSDAEMPNPQTGELENEYVLSIVTAMGDVESGVTLSRPPMFSIPEGEPFKIKLESTQNIKFLGIPILAKYNIGNRNINLGLKAGMLANFILNSDLEIKRVDNPSPMFHHKKHRIKDKSELKNLDAATIDFMAGVEAELKLNSSTSLSIEPTFSRSLTSVFEKNKVKTFPMMASVRVGMNYHF